jgi:hypothetical protein
MSRAYYDERAQSCGLAVNSSEFAAMMDNEDPLRSFRSKFVIPDAPKGSGRDKVLYFVGKLHSAPKTHISCSYVMLFSLLN